MMNSKISSNHERHDIMTTSHSVPTASNLEQLEHSNHIFEQYDPVISACDFRFNEVFRKPLSQIDGMASGVRADFLNGKFLPGGFADNQCPDPASASVCFWVLAE